MRRFRDPGSVEVPVVGGAEGVSWSDSRFPSRVQRALGKVFACGLALAAVVACGDASPTGAAGGEIASVQVLTASKGKGSNRIGEVTPSTGTIDVGATLQLVAVSSSGSEVRGVSWSSGSPEVAAVTGNGLVTGASAGAATITARTGNTSASAKVTVVAAADPAPTDPAPTDPENPAPAVATVKVSPEAPSLAPGATVQLSASARDAAGNVLTGRGVAWSSSDAAVATVSPTGLVTAVAAGSARVRATVDGSVSGEAAVTVTAGTGGTVAPPAPAKGIWIGAADLAARPTSGAAWDALLRDAARDPGVARVSDQDSNHDIYTLAAALVCARTGQHCDKARRGVVSAIGTEQGGRWLAVGRNLTGYVIAADLLGLRADGNPSSEGTRVQNWIASFLTMKLAHNNSGEPHAFIPFESGSNASAQEGAAYAAVAAYVGNRTALDRAWDAFRTYACDPTAPNRERIDLSKGVEYGWAHNDAAPCAINPAGTTKRVPSGYAGAGQVQRIDGAIINDMRRGGHFQWAPGYTQYPWVGLEGFVPAAVILHRAGYGAFQVADRAVLRTHEYLLHLRTATGDARWFDGSRAAEVVHLVNVVYGKSFPVRSGIGAGRTVGYTDWSHAVWPR